MMSLHEYDIAFGEHPVSNKPSYLYTYACHETERELCCMELTELFGHEPEGENWLQSERWIDPDRSPFLTACLDVRLKAESIERMVEQAASIQLKNRTFKVVCLKAGDRFSYEELRGYERTVGRAIAGQAQMKTPDVTLGMVSIGGIWRLGILHEPERAWLDHRRKPQNYSTGLSSRVAGRSSILLFRGWTESRFWIPAAGMGNVLIEALSMGITAEGRDINPLAIRGARVNLKHYGYDDNLVAIQDMNSLQGHYDVAILDLPYNLCSVFPEGEKLQMLHSLRRLSDRAVIVSTESLREQLVNTGWKLLRHGTTRKGSFVREIWMCE